jgi:hypothetical protein
MPVSIAATDAKPGRQLRRCLIAREEQATLRATASTKKDRRGKVAAAI